MNRSSSILLALFGAFALTACSSGDIKVGSTGQALQKTKNGGPTGNGQTCSWSDTVTHDVASGSTTTTPNPAGEYKVGDSFKSLDACNDCTCTEQGIVCTERACAPVDGGGAGCAFNSEQHAPGDTFKSADGCNTCTCGADGTVACTEMACVDPATQVCEYDGKTYKIGDSFQSSDGCNSCTCQPNGGIVCTARACAPVACTDDAKQCPNGTWVGRTGPNCEFVCP